jgi:hypothetical protein
MIIFAKADGTVVDTKPTPFYQGSSLKGSIYLVAPFPNTNGVTIQFQLPNGNITKAYPMTPTGEVEGVMLDGYEVSAWTWDVKNAMVTAIPGVVTATIKVIDTDDNVISIVSSFSIIKGTPNALDPSTPSADEWQAIISALGSIGGKVTMPLMTNFEYNPTTGESEKTYNNGMVQTQTFPAINQNGFVEYDSFTRSTFSNNWETSNRTGYSKMLIISEPTIGSASGDFDITIFKGDENSAEKMNPLIVVDKDTSSIGIYSNEAYAGYALFFWKGSFVEQNYLPSIEKAKLDAEVATSQAEIATERANSISQTLEDAYENGEFGIPSGGTAGQILTKTESGTAWQDAPSGGGGISWMSLIESTGIIWEDASDYNGYFLIPKGYTSYTFYNSYGYILITNEMMESGGTVSFSFNPTMGLKILTNPYYDETGFLSQEFYAVRAWNFMGNTYIGGMNGTLLKME